MATEMTPTTPSSPLGIDPATTPPASSVVVTPEAKPEVTPPAGKQLTQAEYDALQQRASNYDLISNDPELAPKILDHFRAKTGRLGAPVNTPPVTPPVVDANKQETDRQFREFAARQAKLEVQLFRKDHPDADDYKDDMAKLINRYGMDLEDAYRHSKAVKAQSSQLPAKVPPVVPTSETNRSAGELDASDESLSEVEKRINDPKATPHMDDVIDLAWKAARNKHAG